MGADESAQRIIRVHGYCPGASLGNIHEKGNMYAAGVQHTLAAVYLVGRKQMFTLGVVISLSAQLVPKLREKIESTIREFH